MISSGGGDADDGVDSALGEPGSGGEFSVHRSWTRSRALQRVTDLSEIHVHVLFFRKKKEKIE